MNVITDIEQANSIEKYLQRHFSDIERCSPYSENILQEFLKLGPFHSFIPRLLGGCGDNSASYLKTLETVSYYSLPLGLTMGITGSLFIMPIVKHAPPALRNRLVSEFLNGTPLGGIMITEPTGGTDIFGLQTSLSSAPGGMLLNGAKCWGGLTGKAEHWLVAARKMQDGKLTRSLNLVYVPLSSPGIKVHTYFDALGLQPIPYGETRYSNVVVPEEHNLTPGGKGALRVLYDTLFRSRMNIPAIVSGFCKRLSEESAAWASRRMVFGQSIDSYDQVQFRLSALRGFAQINHCIRRFVGTWMDGHDDVSGDYVLVNSVKFVSSTTMAIAADSAIHLFAASAYKRNHLVGRAYVDCRPFQIFEGSNDVLDDNTFSVLAGRYGRVSPEAISQELEKFGLRMPSDLPKGALDALDVKEECSQRRRVQYGRIIEWIVVRSLVEHIGMDQKVPVEDARRVTNRYIASCTAELAYL